MSVPYYAAPGYAPPPFLATLDVIEDLTDSKCWRNGCERSGTGAVGLCHPHHAELVDDGTP